MNLLIPYLYLEIAVILLSIILFIFIIFGISHSKISEVKKLLDRFSSTKLDMFLIFNEKYKTLYISDNLNELCHDFSDLVKKDCRALKRLQRDDLNTLDSSKLNSIGFNSYEKTLRILYDYNNHQTLWAEQYIYHFKMNHKNLYLLCLFDRTKTMNDFNALKKSAGISNLKNKEKSEFLSCMSHDIRTPINTILNMSELAQESIDNKEELMKYFKNIDVASNYLTVLINDVLDISKIESNHYDLDIEDYDISSLFDKMHLLMDGQMKKKNHNFKLKMNAKNIYVKADGLVLEKIFLNLLSNAYKYTPAYGIINFVCDEIENKNPNLISYKFTVSDNGIGMSEEMLSHLYDPFKREDKVIKGDIEGTGLGMVIVKDLVDLLKGNINIKSSPNLGTSFFIDVTFPKGVKIKKIENKKELYSWKDKKYILAEDNLVNLLVLKKRLEDRGALISIAKDGIEAMNLFLESPIGYYDGILMDVLMPKMNVSDATKRIRKANRPDNDILIVALTANAFKEDKDKCLEAGMNSHVAKPINFKELSIRMVDIVNEYKKTKNK